VARGYGGLRLFSVKMLRGRAKLYPTPYWEKTYWEGITYLLLFLSWVGTMAKYMYAWFRGMSMSWDKNARPSDVLNDLYGVISEYNLPYVELVFRRLDGLKATDLAVADYVVLIITDLSPFGTKIVASYFDGYRVAKISDVIYLAEKNNVKEKYSGIYVVYHKEKIFYDTLDPLYVLNDVKNKLGNEHTILIRVAYLGTSMDILHNKRRYKKIVIITPIKFMINEDMVRQVFGQEYDVIKLSKSRGYLLTRKENVGSLWVKPVAVEPGF
jgi:hypothetical protein